MTSRERDIMLACGIVLYFLHKSQVANNNYKLAKERLDIIKNAGQGKVGQLETIEEEGELIGEIKFEV